VVEPVDVGEGGEFDVIEALPGPLVVDEFPLVQALEALDEGVVMDINRQSPFDPTDVADPLMRRAA